jgi:succinate dehydrogenase/fumarate reductase-like Fe-S protein
MAEAAPMLHLRINNHAVTVREGTTVAAALLSAGAPARISVTGEPRAALCGMGICYECRATVNGIAHQRTCLLACAPDMQVETGPQVETVVGTETR